MAFSWSRKMSAKRTCGIWEKMAPARGGQRRRKEDRCRERAEVKFIRESPVRVPRQPAPARVAGNPLFCCWLSLPGALRMSVAGTATERSLSICTVDFLVPLPEGEAFHRSQLKASKSAHGNCARSFSHLAVPLGCLHLLFLKNQGSG